MFSDCDVAGYLRDGGGEVKVLHGGLKQPGVKLEFNNSSKYGNSRSNHNSKT
jgi:hypothetical protein